MQDSVSAYDTINISAKGEAKRSAVRLSYLCVMDILVRSVFIVIYVRMQLLGNLLREMWEWIPRVRFARENGNKPAHSWWLRTSERSSLIASYGKTPMPCFSYRSLTRMGSRWKPSQILEKVWVLFRLLDQFPAKTKGCWLSWGRGGKRLSRGRRPRASRDSIKIQPTSAHQSPVYTLPCLTRRKWSNTYHSRMIRHASRLQLELIEHSWRWTAANASTSIDPSWSLSKTFIWKLMRSSMKHKRIIRGCLSRLSRISIS